MPSKLLSGKDGFVKVGDGNVAHITTWSINRTQTTPKSATSSTDGEVESVGGNFDTTGSFTCLYSTETTEKIPIQDFPMTGLTVEFHIDDTRKIVGEINVTSISIGQVNVATPELIPITCEFTQATAMDFSGF